MEERNQANGQTTVVAKDEEHLYKLVKETIAKNGPACDLNFIDVSGINNMRGRKKDARRFSSILLRRRRLWIVC